jgi:phospholipase C
MAILSGIDHIVVLMLENRSFDNVLGWLYAEEHNQPARNIPAPPDGAAPSYFGLEEGLHSLPLTYAGKTRSYPIVKGTCGNGLNVPGMDPWEEYRHVTNQIFGSAKKFEPPTPEPACAPSADMQGFLQDFTEAYLADPHFVDDLKQMLIERLGVVAGNALWLAIEALPESVRAVSLQSWNESLQITQTFTPKQLPILNGLAKHFAVSDMWFASVPSQTNPNRAFFHCGTSLGRESNSNLNADEHFETDTIWNVLHEQAPQCTWGIYYQEDFPPNSGKCFTDYTFPRIRDAGDNFYPLQHFFDAVCNDTLPAFSFLEPKWGWGVNKNFSVKSAYHQGNDYHPPTSTAAGEAFVKDVYDTLLESSIWPRTLFVVTFDEHGGTFDHVSPPCPAPRPDDHQGVSFKFKFDRYGVRVPTILVSPWVEQGTVFRSGSRLPYDHTSLTATILEWAGVHKCVQNPETGKPWLGNRVSVAPTFEDVLTRDTPRTDKPKFTVAPKPALRPITVTNQTPAQMYGYLGWGPTDKKPYCLEWPQYIQPGESKIFDTERGLAYQAFDYFVAGSYWVGNPNDTPTGLVDRTNMLGQNWRLFWQGWKLTLHHQEMLVTQPAPKASFSSSRQGPIVIRNNTPARIYAYLGWRCVKTVPCRGWPRYIQPGEEASFDPSHGWFSHDYFVAASYWVGHPNNTPPALVDRSAPLNDCWRLLWKGWKAIRQHQTLTIDQPPPTAEIL